MDASNGSQSSINTNITTPPSSSDSGAEYAWLVHSQNTLRDTLPPTVDNKPLARQRRRRTSPEDQAILEAEYNKNSKPDKNARRAIVERVAGMGEKEVQIWFQNRRQNSRRRAQPLPEAQEPLKMTVENSFVSDAEDDCVVKQAGDIPTGTVENLPGTQSPRVVVPEKTSDGSKAAMEAPLSTTQEAATAMVPVKEGPSNTTRSLKRSSSGVRISLTSNGGARILQEHESSPSPPRPERHLTGFIDMSTDDSLLGLSTTNLFPTSRKQRRLTSGRSRDSRSWEFWCDNDASRNELGLKAQQEQSGSASDAISLMRSQSSRSALTALDRSSWLRRGDSSRATRRPRPSLARASTTSGALGRGKEGFELFEESVGTNSSARLDSRFVKSPGGDSDKENHDPNALPVPSKRRALGEIGAQKASLRKSRTVPSNGVKASRGAGLPRGAASRGEGHAHETDEELKRFMGRGNRDQEHPAISSEDDLNCVQSLLFLSQGH